MVSGDDPHGLKALRAEPFSPAAQEAFLRLAAEHPDDPAVLGAFGTWLLVHRRLGAAQMVFERLVARHPLRAEAHSQLAQCLLARDSLDAAQAVFRHALALAPDLASAHLGLAEALERLGNDDGAHRHRERGFAVQPVWVHPLSRPENPRVLVLATASPGSTPLVPAIDPSRWSLTAIVPDYYPADRALPEHDLVFNAVSDADRAPRSLARAATLAARSGRPVVNAPERLAATTREAVSRAIGGVPDVIAPRIERVARKDLLAPDGAARLAASGWRFPLLVRTPGQHTGHDFAHVASPHHLPSVASGLGGDDLLVIEWLGSAPQGVFRKLRWMLVDGTWHPLHLALSRHWKIHYFSADLVGTATHRAAEARFLTDPENTMGRRAMDALTRLSAMAPFDIGGVDCDVAGDGRLLVFEMNATMVVAPPAPDVIWDYRRASYQRLTEAVGDMLRRRLLDAGGWR